jgi:hypothetical protein
MPGEEYLLALGHLPPDTEETSQARSKTLFPVYFRRRLVFKKTLVYHFSGYRAPGWIIYEGTMYIQGLTSPHVQYPVMST